MLFTLKFLKELPLYETVQPYRLHGFPDLEDEKKTNCIYEHVDGVLAEDLRASPKQCRFEDEGFEFVTAPSRCDLRAENFESNGASTDGVVENYVQETMDLVRERLSADAVVAIDWRFRRNDDNSYPLRLEGGDIRKQAIAVATTAHCDFSHDGGLERIRTHLTEGEMQDVDGGAAKAMIVNVWRPLLQVRSAPLVLADRRTIAKSDMIEADQVMTDKVNKTAYVYYRPDQKWYWLSHQTPDEAVLFATWRPESQLPHADCSPHVAAYLYGLGKGVQPRESVEVRMITLFKETSGVDSP